MTSNRQGACIACGSRNTSTLVDIADIPVYTNVPQPSREAAVAVSKGEMNLIYCEDCSHLCNQLFDPALIEYAPGYEAALDFSPRFREYADELARSLIDRFDIRNKRVVSVACGRGEFLRRLCELGPNSGIGFDPSYEGEEYSDDGNIRFIRDYYSDKYSHYAADFLCCRHALEHIPQPRPFMESLHSALSASEAPYVYFEVPNSLYTLKDLGIWDLIYEHCSYFSGDSLARLFLATGFEVLDVSESFGGQFLGVIARPVDTAATVVEQHFDGEGIAGYASAFGSNFHSKLVEWSERLAQMATTGEKVVVWGGGSKAVTFLNSLKTESTVKYVVDINPRKTSLYVPGTGQQIVQPSTLMEYRPDTVIIMNPIYIEEITQQLAVMGLTPRVLVA